LLDFGGRAFGEPQLVESGQLPPWYEKDNDLSPFAWTASFEEWNSGTRECTRYLALSSLSRGKFFPKNCLQGSGRQNTLR